MHGFDVTAVPDGRAALDALIAAFSPADASGEAAAAPAPFDVAVLDVQMPVLDGPGAAAAFREFERTHRPERAPLPILALSAAVAEEAVQTCAAAGMQAFIAKPLRAEDIAMVRATAADYAETRRDEEAQQEDAPRAKRAKQRGAGSPDRGGFSNPPVEE